MTSTNGRAANPTVSARDRAALERQAMALAAEEQIDDDDAAWEALVVTWSNRVRAARGDPPLRKWWETKTEPELRERARAIGLLD